MCCVGSLQIPAPTAPRRIVSLLASATEILYGIGAGDRVVGISHECDYPPAACDKPRLTAANIDDRGTSAAIDGEVRAKLAAGAPLYRIDQEQLIALAPDLIVTQAQCDVCAVKYQDVLDLVDQTPALHSVAVVALNPNSLTDIFADIDRVGAAAGASAGADAYRRSLQARVAAIRDRTAILSADQRPRTAIIEWIEPLMLSGNWLPELVEIAGGEHGLTKAGAHSPYVAWSAVATYDPQVIIVAPCGFNLNRTLAEAALLRSLPEWPGLTAVRENHVYAVDGNAYFNRSGPRIVDSLELLAHLLQPQLCAAPSWADDMNRNWRRWTSCPAGGN